MTLENRVVVITGATDGLGSVLTRDLANRGVNLALLDRDAERLTALTSGLALPESRFMAQLGSDRFSNPGSAAGMIARSLLQD